MEGNRQTRCTTDGTWTSKLMTCAILNCNDSEVEIANSQLVSACNVTYCMVQVVHWIAQVVSVLVVMVNMCVMI